MIINIIRIFLNSCLIIFLFVFGLKAEGRKNYLEYKITFNENFSPIVHIPLNGELVPLVIDTGALGMGLSLSKDVLETFEELTEVGVDRYTDLTGKVSDVKQYKLNELEIEGLRFKNLVINEYYQWGLYSKQSKQIGNYDQIKGVIGIQLLEQYPIILDFVNNKFFILSSAEVVPDEIYERSKWKKIKFALNSHGIEISTSFGSNNRGSLDLDTASTISIIKPNMVPHNEVNYNCELLFQGQDKCSYYLAPDLKLDNVSFGQQQFIIYSFNEPLSSGILGYDYLNGKIIYLDLKSKFMLFSATSS